jgi:hypothetical protein
MTGKLQGMRTLATSMAAIEAEWSKTPAPDDDPGYAIALRRAVRLKP